MTPRRWFIAVAVGVVVYRLAIWVLVMRHVPLIGDENYFWERSRFIVRWAEGRASGNELDRLVNRAWWMPGPIVLVAPVRAFTRGIAEARLWFGIVDLVLLFAATAVVARAFGRRVGLAFLTIVGLFPDTAAQSFGIWGEPIAAKLLVVVLVGATLVAPGRTPPGRAIAAAVGLGAILGAAIYFRPPLILHIPIVAGLLLGRPGNEGRSSRWSLPP